MGSSSTISVLILFPVILRVWHGSDRRDNERSGLFEPRVRGSSTPVADNQYESARARCSISGRLPFPAVTSLMLALHRQKRNCQPGSYSAAVAITDFQSRGLPIKLRQPSACVGQPYS